MAVSSSRIRLVSFGGSDVALRFRPLHPTFDVEVIGVDLSRDVDAATVA